MILAQVVPLIFGLRPEFLLFGLTLLGVALFLFHRYTLFVGLIGLTSILIFKFIFIPEFNLGEHLFGQVPFIDQILHKEMRVGEWSVLLNLFGLLIGFALLSWHFEKSGLPDYLPQFQPLLT